MKWLPLKMNFLPLIFQEINNVTEEYITYLSKIRQKQLEKEKAKSKPENNVQSNEETPSRKTSKNLEQTESENENIKYDENEEENDLNEQDEEEIGLIIKKFNGLRESISKRINELEDFYEDNIEDVRVSNFEKARLRLKKLLMYNYDNINKVENSSQQKNIFIKNSNDLFNKKLTEDTKKKILENNISLEKQNIKGRNKKKKKKKKKLMSSSNESKKKTISKKGDKKNKNKVIKVRGDEGFLKPTERGRKSSVVIESDVDGLDFDDYSKCREIIFKIKLNQDEYKLLLKEKKNKGHLSPYLFK